MIIIERGWDMRFKRLSFLDDYIISTIITISVPTLVLSSFNIHYTAICKFNSAHAQ